MKKVFLVIMVLVVFTTGCGKKAQIERIPEESIKSNTNEEVIGKKEIDGLTIEKSSLVYEDGLSTLTTSITNTTQERMMVDSIKITYIDSEDNETVLVGPIGDYIEPSQVVYITSTTDIDLSAAVKVVYEIVK